MNITLKLEQEAWLKTQVAAGGFISIEEAARRLVDERIAERELEESDDLAWAKPTVDEGLAALARGEFMSLDEHKARNAFILATLRRQWRVSSSPQHTISTAGRRRRDLQLGGSDTACGSVPFLVQ